MLFAFGIKYLIEIPIIALGIGMLKNQKFLYCTLKIFREIKWQYASGVSEVDFTEFLCNNSELNNSLGVKTSTSRNFFTVLQFFALKHVHGLVFI